MLSKRYTSVICVFLTVAFVNVSSGELLFHLDGDVIRVPEAVFQETVYGNHAVPTDGNTSTAGLTAVDEINQSLDAPVGRVAISFSGNGPNYAANLPSTTPELNRSFTAFTLSLWYQPHSDENDDNGNPCFLIGKMGLSGDRGWQLAHEDDIDDLQFVYFDGPSGNSQGLDMLADVSSFASKHLAITYTANGSVKMYSNGMLLHEYPGALSSLNGDNTAMLQVGNRGDYMLNSANGIIDDVGIWDEALTDVHIAAIHALGYFEDVDLSDQQKDDFLDAFANQTSVRIKCNTWQYINGLTGPIGSIGGGTASCDAYVILDENGNGMQQVSCGTPILSDLSGDCRVDLVDLALLAAEWLQDGTIRDENVTILRQYNLKGSANKFGDVDGDGLTDILSIHRDDWSVYVYDHSGTELWHYQAPNESDNYLRAQHEPPGAIWDLDQDGYGEVLHWRLIDGVEYLVAADGITGAILKQVPWATRSRPHDYNSFRFSIAHLHDDDYPNDVVAYTDSGNNTVYITAYDPNLVQIWQHYENRNKDHLGHYPYPRDLNADGIDEVVLSHLVLNADGSVLWNNLDIFSDNHDHFDSIRFADVTGDDQVDIIAPLGPRGVYAFDALTGATLWSQPASHAQQIEFANVLDLPGATPPDIAVSDRYYNINGVYLSGHVLWYSAAGTLLKAWPEQPIAGNPDFGKGDWEGTGGEELFWYHYRMLPDGTGEFYFDDEVIYMFDFNMDGADEAICRKNLSDGKSRLRIYGSPTATRSSTPVQYTPDEIRHRITNLTHY